MCGILGIYSKKGTHTSKLQSALATLDHRGPDSKNHWISSNQKMALGHTRLSIMDPENGTQPIKSRLGNLVVANGELYGHREILQGLKEEGYSFHSDSDSEIILPLYEKHGLDALSKLNGEFAFIISEPEKDRLTAVRDRFGVKPLYYYENDDKLILASEIKALLELGASRKWNQEHSLAIGTNLALNPTESLFEGVKQVPPGHFLRMESGSVSITKYWDLNFNNANDQVDHRQTSDILQGYRERFFKAVETRLDADVPIGVYLSGGLDSCSVLGVGSKLAKKPLTAFSILFEDDDYSEDAEATEMASSVSAEHHKVFVSDQDIVENFEKAMWHSEYFFLNSHGVAKFILSRLVRDSGFKAVLTGEGADENLAGYVNFKQDYLKELYPTVQDRQQQLEVMFEENEASRGFLTAENTTEITCLQEKLGFTPSHWEAIANHNTSLRSLFSKDLTNKVSAFQGYEKVLDQMDVSKIERADMLHKSLFVWAKARFPNYVLNVLGDRMEMAHSIEARLPFLDQHVVEFLQNVPSHLKINGETEKFIHREAVKDCIPETIYRRQKHPFLNTPATTKPNSKLFDYYKEVLFDSSFDSIPMFDHKTVRELVLSIPTMPHDLQQKNDWVLSTIVSMTVLGRLFGMEA